MTKDKELLHLMRVDGIDTCTITAGLEMLDDGQLKDLNNECGKISFYDRLACIYLMACNQDGLVADEELDNVKALVGFVFSRAEVDLDVDQTISRARKFMKTADAFLLDGTVSVFRKYLSKEMLKGIINDCYYMCDADGMDERESVFLLNLYKRFLG